MQDSTGKGRIRDSLQWEIPSLECLASLNRRLYLREAGFNRKRTTARMHFNGKSQVYSIGLIYRDYFSTSTKNECFGKFSIPLKNLMYNHTI